MAENAAHFTATLEAKPSIFEVIAQQSLNAILHPALRKVALVSLAKIASQLVMPRIQFLATVNPRRFGWVAEYYEEVFFVLNGLLQHHYLRTQGASFSEYFYGLRRSVANSDATKLSNDYKRLSFVFLVILPYIRRKLEERIQIYRMENAEGFLQLNFSGICKKAILCSYSISEITLNLWTLLQYLHYMSDQSEFQTPSLWISNMKLIYITDMQESGFWTALFRGQLSLVEFSKGLFQNTVQSFLELSAFFVQFLQVWNAERSNYSFSALPAVPPPEPDSKARDFKGKCPLCLQNWKIPTVLPVSGYVFCFPCIVRHLQDDQHCPVTNLPAKPLDVIRLYDSFQ